jgi:hypothetical protein
LLASALGAGAPSVAWAKGKHAARKSRAESATAADLTPPPADPASEDADAGSETTAPAPAKTPAAPVPAVPMVDASGRVQYGPPGPGTGSVTVKGDRMQVTLDGRSFGIAPLTIYNVPKGDYIVEGTGPDGTEVSRPVTVDDNGQATVDLGAGMIGALSPAERLAEERSRRVPLASKVLLGVSGAALGVGIVFGVLQWKAHRDYESAADQATLDALARTGHRDAMIANVSFITCGASLLASGLFAIPSLLKSERPASEAGTVTVTAAATRGAAMAGVSWRF